MAGQLSYFWKRNIKEKPFWKRFFLKTIWAQALPLPDSGRPEAQKANRHFLGPKAKSFSGGEGWISLRPP
jgi:hypothetical protein